MREIIHKVFWAWDYPEEEKWLNKMSEHGLQLVHVGFCKYEFEEGAAGEYSYRIELLSHFVNSAQGKECVRFIEETGAEQVASYFWWAYFRKKTSEGPFDLFSDIDSRIEHLQRINYLLLPLGVANLLIGLVNLSGFFARGFVGNGSIGSINVALSLLLFYGVWQIGKKKLQLKKERALHE